MLTNLQELSNLLNVQQLLRQKMFLASLGNSPTQWIRLRLRKEPVRLLN